MSRACAVRAWMRPVPAIFAVVLLAVGITFYSLSRVTTVEQADAATAEKSFVTVLEPFESAAALLRRDPEGHWIRSAQRDDLSGDKLKRIRVLAY